MLVFCNGMIRAGSTLQYNYVRSIIEQSGRGRGIGFYSAGQMEELQGRLEEWSRNAALSVIKSHDWSLWQKQLVEDGHALVCYIYRDIRDVAVSAKRIFGYDNSALLARLDNAIQIYDEISGLENSLVQKYETVVFNPHEAVAELGRFVSEELDRNVIERIVDDFSIDRVVKAAQQQKLRSQIGVRLLEVLGGLGLPTLARGMGVPVAWRLSLARRLTGSDARTQFHPGHVSRTQGMSVWREELSNREIEELSDRYAAWLDMAGYEIRSVVPATS